MAPGRQKNFYSVTNGRVKGVFTNWTQAGNSVNCFAGAKHKGYSTYSEAVTEMVKAGIPEFLVYDGENTYSHVEYEKMKTNISRGVAKNKADNCRSPDDCLVNQSSDLPVLNTSSNDNKEKADIVYIDGSCISNSNKAKQAGIGIFWGHDHPWNCSESLIQDEPTNNKAELKAAIKAIEIAKERALKNLIVRSDSMYVVKGITKWVHLWQSNEWKTSDKKDVKNKELWCKLLELTENTELCITWEHVIAHSGVEGNEEADRMAMNAAQTILQSDGAPEDIISNRNQCRSKSQKTEKLPTKDLKDLDKTIDDTCENTTPKVVDKSFPRDTPESVSTNGISANINDSPTSNNNKKQKNINKTMDEETTIKCINNVELVLQGVMTELHQIKQHQVEFKFEVKAELDILKEQQRSSEQVVKNLLEIQKQSERSMTSLSKDFADGMKNVNKKMIDLNESQKLRGVRCQPKDSTNTEELSKKVECCLGDVNSSIQSVEKSVVTLLEFSKQTTDQYKVSEDNNLRVHESMAQLKKSVTQSTQSIVNIENTLTALSEREEFFKPKKSLKPKTIDGQNECIPLRNTFSELEAINAESSKTHKATENALISKDPGVADRTSSNGTNKSAHASEQYDNSQTNTKAVPNSQPNEDAKTSPRRPRKPKICLIGDSISGQINPAKLGKATGTYIQKLRAPKVNDLVKTVKEVKDADMIIIHTGINNLREKEDTSGCINSLVEKISSMKAEAPDTKIVISKVIPIGNNLIDIERNIYNAQCEKKISEVFNNEVTFIDHGNLSERGVPIKSLYRPDLVHLSYRGAAILAGNIKEVINHQHSDNNKQTNDDRFANEQAPETTENRNAKNEYVGNVRSPVNDNVRQTGRSSGDYNVRPKYDERRSNGGYRRYDRYNSGEYGGRREERNSRKNGYNDRQVSNRKYHSVRKWDSSGTMYRNTDHDTFINKRHFGRRGNNSDYNDNKRNGRRWY